ncbi:MAG: SOS response-associated peptidase [Chloroflexi bacterium]|nr:SOS response-associated peptidase [Chloroflexota bacterium]
MCGRYTLITDMDTLQARFSFERADLGLALSFNVAPTQQVLTVVNDGENRARYMRWGLIPSWAKDASIGSRMINARAETLAEKPSFRSAFRRRRCLVLADSFYEWKKVGTGKTPTRIVLKSREPFAFAGLWESWNAPDGERVLSCAIVTTDPNSLMEPIHNRMPVILSRDAESVWLDQSIEDAAMLGSLLTPYDAEEMEAYEVSTLVNSPANNSPELIARVARMLP